MHVVLKFVTKHSRVTMDHLVAHFNRWLNSYPTKLPSFLRSLALQPGRNINWSMSHLIRVFAVVQYISLCENGGLETNIVLDTAISLLCRVYIIITLAVFFG